MLLVSHTRVTSLVTSRDQSQENFPSIVTLLQVGSPNTSRGLPQNRILQPCISAFFANTSAAACVRKMRKDQSPFWFSNSTLNILLPFEVVLLLFVMLLLYILRQICQPLCTLILEFCQSFFGVLFVHRCAPMRTAFCAGWFKHNQHKII